MKIDFRLLFYSTSIAVCLGVAIFGVNSAMGMEAPRSNASGSTTEAPTFFGIDIGGNFSNPNGSIVIPDSLDISGAIQNPAGILSIPDNIDAQVDILNSAGSVTIADNLDVNTNVLNNGGQLITDDILDLRQTILNSGGNVSFSDPIEVTGNLYLNNGSLSNTGTPPVSVSDTVDITGAMTITVNISNDSGNVTVNDPLRAIGKITSTVGFGTTQSYDSDACSINPNGFCSLAQACPTGSQIITCRAMNNDLESPGSNMGIVNAYVDAPINACRVEIYNPTSSGIIMDYWARTTCLNPSI